MRLAGSPLDPGVTQAGDVVNGYGIKQFHNGNLFAGDFVDGKRNGRGVQRWRDGHVFIGQWLKDQRHRGEYRFSHGDMDGSGAIEDNECERYVGEWKDDQMHGKGAFVGGYLVSTGLNCS